MQNVVEEGMNGKAQITDEEGYETNPFFGLRLRQHLSSDITIVGHGDRGAHKGDDRWRKISAISEVSQLTTRAMYDIHLPFIFEAT